MTVRGCHQPHRRTALQRSAAPAIRVGKPCQTGKRRSARVGPQSQPSGARGCRDRPKGGGPHYLPRFTRAEFGLPTRTGARLTAAALEAALARPARSAATGVSVRTAGADGDSNRPFDPSARPGLASAGRAAGGRTEADGRARGCTQGRGRAGFSAACWPIVVRWERKGRVMLWADARPPGLRAGTWPRAGRAGAA